MLMGGGFMQTDKSGFGPFGGKTSQKWRGYGRSLVGSANKYGGQGGHKLTNVNIVPTYTQDEYQDSYLTLIADTTGSKKKY